MIEKAVKEIMIGYEERDRLEAMVEFEAVYFILFLFLLFYFCLIMNLSWKQKWLVMFINSRCMLHMFKNLASVHHAFFYILLMSTNSI